MKAAHVALSLALLGLSAPALAQYKYQGIQTPPQRTSQPGYQPQNYPTPNVRGSDNAPFRLGSPTTTRGSGSGITAGQRSAPSMLGTHGTSTSGSTDSTTDRLGPSGWGNNR